VGNRKILDTGRNAYLSIKTTFVNFGKRDEGLLAVERLLAPGALRRKIVNSPILGIADYLVAMTPDDRDSSWVLRLPSDILRRPHLRPRWDQKFESAFLQRRVR
jgi:hypothetical protein